MENKKCEYTTAQIGQYMMNKMSPEEETRLQEHLYSCPECRRKLQEMRRLADALSDEKLNTPVKKKREKQHFVKVLVSALLLVTGGYGLYLWQAPDPGTVIHPPTPAANYHHTDYHHTDSLPLLDSLNRTRDTSR